MWCDILTRWLSTSFIINNHTLNLTVIHHTKNIHNFDMCLLNLYAVFCTTRIFTPKIQRKHEPHIWRWTPFFFHTAKFLKYFQPKMVCTITCDKWRKRLSLTSFKKHAVCRCNRTQFYFVDGWSVILNNCYSSIKQAKVNKFTGNK